MSLLFVVCGLWFVACGLWLLARGSRHHYPLSTIHYPLSTICLTMLLCPLAAPAEAASVQASVDRNTAALGESVQLRVSASGVGDGDVDVSPIRDFKVIPRGRSTNLRVVNGTTSREIVFNYTLVPLKAGDLRIPPLAVRTPGGDYRTLRIDITVSERPQESAEDRDIFVRAEVSNDRPYAGEQLVYTFRLYRTLRITEARFQKPDFAGFTAEQIGEERSDIAVINGKRFHTTTLSYVLIPLTAGPKTIQPAVLECGVVQRDHRGGSSPFDFDSLFGRGRVDTRALRTDAIDIDVRPLPDHPEPHPFSGLVGKMDIRASLDKKDLKTGESATLTLVIEGAGNIVDAEAPAMDVPDGFKVYADAPQEEIALDPNGYFGKKTFRMALVPLEPGAYRLPPANLTYFDTGSETYVDRRTASFDLTVGEREAEEEMTVVSAPNGGNGTDKQKVAFTGRDILPIREDLSALETRRPLSIQWFLALLGIPAALFAGVGGVFLALRKGDDPAGRMARRARVSLKKAGASGIGEDVFLSCLYRGVVSAILSRSGASGESLTGAEAEMILNGQGFPPEVVQGASGLLELIESAKFGGAPLASPERERLLAETRRLVRRIS